MENNTLKTILDKTVGHAKNPIAAFIIGSYIYNQKYAKDIDVVLISTKENGYFTDTLRGKKLKVSVISLHSLKTDIKKTNSGTFFSGRFMNPVIILKGKRTVNSFQKKILEDQLRSFVYRYDIKNSDNMDVFNGFMLERCLNFPSYIKTFLAISKHPENKYIKRFVKLIKSLNLTKGKKFNYHHPLGLKDIYKYWRSRAQMKNESNINWLEILERWNKIETSKNFISELSKKTQNLFDK